MWMDRLSDGIGSLIPGGYRLPPRHPVKVSLVLGVLGFTVGWLICVCLFSTRYLPRAMTDSFIAPLSVCGVYAISGLFVLMPLSVWANQRFILTACSWLVPCTAYPLMLAWSGFALARGWIPADVPTLRSFLCFAILIAIPAAVHASWIVCTIRKNRLAVFVSATTLCSLLGAVLLQWFIYMRTTQTVALVDFSILSTVSTVCMTTLAICLGISLWDTTPRPKFELSEPRNTL
jgi:hypothetical protein